MVFEAQVQILPLLLPLGDRVLLIRFADAFDVRANRRAIAAAALLAARPVPGVTEIVPNLVSVAVHYDPDRMSFAALSGEIALALERAGDDPAAAATHTIPIRYGGPHGPDLEDVAGQLGMAPGQFIAAHAKSRLRVLAIGFAPGFAYCGLHAPQLHIQRRTTVRPSVPAGSILFAAGQTAIAATPIRTGWSVIGHTDFANFDPARTPPTRLQPGDAIVFEAVS
ncbi:5-oxoprolinase subunit B family protein [Pelagibacterium lacus]|nr:carboxyltransferase domain-containing protein [Pelagibacterium lacus]